MFFNVITISLITICAAHRILLSEVTSSKQEVAPQALPHNGHVIYPKMFKYATIDQHSTPSSKFRSVRNALTGNMLWKLQYAPLQGVSSRYKSSDEGYTNPTPTHSNAPVEPTKWLQDKKGKSHLEPRTETTDKKCYAKGYKPDALQSAFRSPGHNAVYTRLSYNERTNSESNLSEPVARKPITSKYDKPIGINLDLQSLKSTTYIPFIDLNSDDMHMPLTLTQESFVINPNSLETDRPMKDKKKRFSSHSKFHRLHLNVARVYSPGQVPPKPPAYAHAYADNIARSPPKSQVYIPQAIQESSKNTLLFPIKKHRKGNYRSHTSIIHYN